MAKNNFDIDMLALEKEMTAFENDVISEERTNAKENYRELDGERKDIESSMPYPDVGQYSTGIDYEDRSGLDYKKRQNKPYYEKLKAIAQYCDDGSLYSGHVYTTGGRNYFIMDSSRLKSKSLGTGRSTYLINADDKAYAALVRAWRYPDENTDVVFSRNISMRSREVLNVDVVIDKGNAAFSEITDAYLRKALVRNKALPGVQSIIQTIQRKQDDIRSLPKEDSFIVQGCAGSGKTMVLLHRLRYLIYNKDISSKDYVLLVPSFALKKFIKDISVQFNISEKCILPYRAYYQMMMGKDKDISTEDASELVFEKDYLSRVYSEEFMQECYGELVDVVDNQVMQLEELCEEKLVELQKEEEERVHSVAYTLRKNLISSAKNITKKVKNYITEVQTVEDILAVKAELEKAYSEKKSAYARYSKSDYRIVISPDDERLVNNPVLVRLKQKIEAEERIIKKASIFTVGSHRKTLELIQREYNASSGKVKEELLEIEMLEHEKRVKQATFVFDGVTLDEVARIVNELTFLLGKDLKEVRAAEEKVDRLDEHVMQTYCNEIATLQELSGISYVSEEEKNRLVPLCPMFQRTADVGRRLLQLFQPYFLEEELKDTFPFFVERTELKQEAYINNRLLQICKKKIANEYHIKLSDLYKHSWYIKLYCRYLTRSQPIPIRKYIFMDEAQDLSVSELNLIRKINTAVNTNVENTELELPILNLFGDVNQEISGHGIEAWDELDFIPNCYELNENFRNPNQIVDFCNCRLPFEMQKVGVDMAPVREYDNLLNALKACPYMRYGAIFIVKDEYAKADLAFLLDSKGIKDYEIYTTRSSKGLEFKEVFVFERDMTIHEKYISYTRALSQLNVVTLLPQQLNPESVLFVQGEEDEDDEQPA